MCCLNLMSTKLHLFCSVFFQHCTQLPVVSCLQFCHVAPPVCPNYRQCAVFCVYCPCLIAMLCGATGQPKLPAMCVHPKPWNLKYVKCAPPPPHCYSICILVGKNIAEKLEWAGTVHQKSV